MGISPAPLEPVFAVEMLEISKAFPGVLANDRISLQIEKGRIHAILGENGAGKSTLISILFGLHQPDSGRIKIMGKEAVIRSPLDASALGIGMVHQHFKLVRNFTVTENIILGSEPRGRMGNINLALAEKQVRTLSEKFGLNVDPLALIENIPVGMQQKTEILKILYRNAEILIFDEPTAVLTPHETEELLSIFRAFKSQGKTIIFITHKLREIKAIADKCTVLRNGKNMGTYNAAQVSEEELAIKMIGRPLSFNRSKKTAIHSNPEAVLVLENLTVHDTAGRPAVKGLSLNVHSGEITGIAGTDGNGQSELAMAIAGLLPVKSGRILLGNRDITRSSIQERIKCGLSFVPEDRLKHGLIPGFGIDENLILKKFRQKPFSDYGFLRFASISRYAKKLIELFDIRAGNKTSAPAASLSGGNQQKMLIAREIDISPRLLLVSQPSRGLDVGAVEYIHRMLLKERDKGCAVLLLSFDLDEILHLCGRAAVISKGVISGEMHD